jgi:glycosyltransferase involved in cell wall biosynthesis
VNVLIIHQHFNSPEGGGALRSYFLAKALVDKGVKVHVLSGSNSQAYFNKDIEGIDVHFLPVAYANQFGFWRRIFSFLKFVIVCIRVAPKFRHVQLCYAISVPLTVGFIARWMKWRYGVQYIFEVGDLWPDAAIELGVINNGFLKNFLWRMERNIYLEAKSVVALSPPIAEAVQKKVCVVVHVIPNMSDCQYFSCEKKDPVLVEKFLVNDKAVISYFGAMGFANGLDHILACALECQKVNLPIQFILAGDGAERENLIGKSHAMHINNVSFHNFQNRDGIRELMNVTDIVFVSYRPSPILETGSPNKFFDGLAAGKPIIINFGGWLRKEIEEAGCGFFVHPNNLESMVPLLQSFLFSDQLSLLGQKSRQLAEQKYAREKLTTEWVQILLNELKVR